MIRKKDKVCSSGPMVESTKGNGKMENNMELGSIHLPRGKPRKESGVMVRELHGLTEIIRITSSINNEQNFLIALTLV